MQTAPLRGVMIEERNDGAAGVSMLMRIDTLAERKSNARPRVDVVRLAQRTDNLPSRYAHTYHRGIA